ncbi:MAG: aminotransferase class I/II-fold pyridoxal phosphate-dependent enzyme [Gemmatimonas sp.]|nr:aminotransferase class I/II-fold pyridoxal phosphate-dependent enzyme [Gemmatimonas sp.]
MPQFSDRYRSLGISWIDTMPLRKAKLLAAGRDVIDLGAGDADLPPPPQVVPALEAAAKDPALGRYGFGMGYAPYREAIARFMKRRFGLDVDPANEVVPLIGSKEGLTHLALLYLSRGDIAIVPEPGFVSYIGGAVLAEATPYFAPLRPEQGFLLDLEEIPEGVLSRARLLYLNYPNNPTAAIAPREYLESVVRFCLERDILLAYDNAYSELTYDGYRAPSIFEIDGAWEVAFEFHSLSKTYNMTGWRLGWTVARPQRVEALALVKSFIDMGHFMPVQAAGAAALDASEEFVPQNVRLFKERRDTAVDAWREAGFDIDPPRATIYLWIRLPAGVPDIPFAERLLEEAGVVVIPGCGLGPSCAGYFRVSLTTTPDRLKEAARRAGEVLEAMQEPAAGLSPP